MQILFFQKGTNFNIVSMPSMPYIAMNPISGTDTFTMYGMFGDVFNSLQVRERNLPKRGKDKV